MYLYIKRLKSYKPEMSLDKGCVMNPFTWRYVNKDSKTYNSLVKDWEQLYYFIYPRSSNRTNPEAYLSDYTGHYHRRNDVVDFVARELTPEVDARLNRLLDDMIWEHQSKLGRNLTADEYSMDVRKWWLQKWEAMAC